MPRMKQGLDYYPMSVDLLDDPKLRTPKMKYGYLAVMVYVSLLGQLYKDKGYYIDYRDRSAVVWQVMSDLQGKWQPNQDTAEKIITDLVAAKLFDTDLYQVGIITCRAAQRNFYRATVTRKAVDIDKNWWLLDLEEMRGISAKHCYYLKMVNEPKNEDNRADKKDDETSLPQSKGKVKVNEVTTATTDNSLDSGGGGGGGDYAGDEADLDIESRREKYGASISLFENVKAAPLSPYELDKLVQLVDEYGGKWVCEALQIMGNAGKCKLNYAEGVLKRWKSDGKDAVMQAKKDDEAARTARVLALMEQEGW